MNPARARVLVLASLLAACKAPSQPEREPPAFADQREAMVRLLANYEPGHKVTDARVLAAMRKVPRHLFVPPDMLGRAYEDGPLPIGEGQTISQPFIVGFMTQILEPKAADRILEIGTGSGYQAAVLAEIVREVDSIEILEPLARRAEATLRKLGYRNVKVKVGDGYRGWPEKAPFDAIIVTCAPDHVPRPLIEQLKTGGRLVIPVGPDQEAAPWVPQILYVIRKTESGLITEKTLDVRFVAMRGEALKRR